MTLHYYMYRSWQDCCRRGENRSWPSVSVESVDSECWCLKNVIVYAFIMRLTVEERVFILESYLKTMSYVHKFLGVVCHWLNKLLILKYGTYGPLLSWTPCIYGTNHSTHCKPSGIPNAHSHIVKNFMVLSLVWRWLFNRLTPNDTYMGRTALLTS